MSHETIDAYIIKDKKLLKRGIDVNEAQGIFNAGQDAQNNSQNIQVNLHGKDGEEIKIFYDQEDLNDHESITVPLGVSLPKNMN